MKLGWYLYLQMPIKVGSTKFSGNDSLVENYESLYFRIAQENKLFKTSVSLARIIFYATVKLLTSVGNQTHLAILK